ncbi:hypothetical protein DLJ53_31690 [Acuticoccus sediminis]|uniref:Uncharacterized protein n=1 Tax=Acuticoccus sediminis TaxID=2184697 RepID=A0A8B2NGD8_9HYPH|nr:hypothetical protein DLJ53_31690 [Acuticoccus sediminis]
MPVSSVPYIGRVNMSSQCVDTLFCLRSVMSTVAGSSISANRPCGAMSFAMSARCWSVSVVE